MIIAFSFSDVNKKGLFIREQKILETFFPITHYLLPITKKRQTFGHISNKTGILAFITLKISRKFLAIFYHQ